MAEWRLIAIGTLLLALLLALVVVATLAWVVLELAAAPPETGISVPEPTPFPASGEPAPPCTFTDVGLEGISYGPYGTRLRVVVAGLQTVICFIDYHHDTPAVLALAWWEEGSGWTIRHEFAEIVVSTRDEVHLHQVPAWAQSDTVNAVVLWDRRWDMAWAAVIFPPAQCGGGR